jgi:hypothetical protein
VNAGYSTRGRRRGQALAEFALVIPFFLLLVFGIIEGGRFIFYYEMLNNATREGARYAIVHGYNAADGCPSGPMPDGSASCDEPGNNVKDAVRKGSLGLVSVGEFISLDVYWCPAFGPKPCSPQLSNDRGNPVTVRAAYRYRPLLPGLPQITIQSESTLVINN